MTRLKNDNWEKVGTVGIDAGLLWLSDPCYVLHKNDFTKELGKDWGEFCDILWAKEAKGDHQFNYDRGSPGLGVCVPTGYGDGVYGVYVQKNNEGRVMKVLVDFEQDMDEEENE